MNETEVLDVTTLSRGFPEEPESRVARDNFIETIEGILFGSTDVVFIEGKEGIGKTILTADFARKHRKETVAVFVRATSKVGYSQTYIRLSIAEQIAFIRGSFPLKDTDEVDDG